MAERICTIESCERKHYGLGWCRLHWQRMRKLGSTDLPPTLTVLEHLAARSVREGDCLVWKGGVNEKGYGGIRVNYHLWKVHRLAWVERHGPIPPETPFVLHRCDNPPCWADEHLFLGTVADNSADMVAKGRSLTGDRHVSVRHPDRVSRGENHVHARLTVEAVRSIRERYAAGQANMTELGIELASVRAQYSPLFIADPGSTSPDLPTIRPRARAGARPDRPGTPARCRWRASPTGAQPLTRRWSSRPTATH